MWDRRLLILDFLWHRMIEYNKETNHWYNWWPCRREHWQLLGNLKTTVEGLVSANSPNVWSKYGGLERLCRDMQSILYHGLIHDQVCILLLFFFCQIGQIPCWKETFALSCWQREDKGNYLCEPLRTGLWCDDNEEEKDNVVINH